MYYRPITIDHNKVATTLSNFPMFFTITLDSLKTVSNGGKIHNTASGGATGNLTVPADFYFASDSEGSNKLDFEVESYNPSTGKLEAWVKVPSLSSSSDTVIYMFYGDPSITTSQENVAGVWSPNHKLVLHMYDQDSSHIKDSTSNGYVGTKEGDPIETTGKLVKAQHFDGSDRINFGNNSNFNSWRTFCMWIRPEVIDNSEDVVVAVWSNSSNRWAFKVDADAVPGDLAFYVTGSGWKDVGDLSLNTWHFVVVTWSEDGTFRTYMNGNLVSTFTGDFGSGSDKPLIFGSFYSGNSTYGFTGILDEVRMRSDAASAEEITTMYNNQNDPSSFYSVGTEESTGGAEPTKYHAPVIEKFEWQPAVIDKDLTSPPTNPSKGDRYIVASSATGDWSGHDGDIAYYDGASWKFIEKKEGMLVFVKDEDRLYHYVTSWTIFGEKRETTRTINLDSSMSASDIQAKINEVGKYIPSGVTITFQFADGTYSLNNSLTFSGFYGGGKIYIQGNTSETNATSLHTTQQVFLDFSSQDCHGIMIDTNSVDVVVRNLKIKVKTSNTHRYAVGAIRGSRIYIGYSYLLGSTNTYGILAHFYATFGYIRRTYVSNTWVGIHSDNALICSEENDDTGTPPRIGLRAHRAGTIGKRGTPQPSGSDYNEIAENGGEIR